MTPSITLQELLGWCEQSADFWKVHLDSNQALLQLPCGIGGNADVQAFVRHIWGAELVWSQIICGLPVTDYDVWPTGPLDALFDLHLQAVAIFRKLLAAPESTWSDPYILNFDWIPPEKRSVSRRKIAAHALFHGQRHWAQLTTLIRNAGFPSDFRGDLLFNPALP